MAVNDGNNGNNNGKPQGGESAMSDAFARSQQQSNQPPRPEHQQQPPQPQMRQPYNIRNLGSLMRRPLNKAPSSEILTKLNTALMAEFSNAADKTFITETLPIDMNAEMGISVSVLVVTVQDAKNTKLGLGYHTLILEGTAEPFQSKYEQIGGQNIEIIRTTGEAFDAKMVEVVLGYLRRQYPNVPQAKMYNADGCVVPRDFNVADAELVHRLAANAAIAASTELETRRDDFFDLDLTAMERDSTLSVRTTYTSVQAMDSVGAPLRSDITIDFSAGAQNTQNQQQMERTSHLARINGFLDLVWDPIAPQQNPYAPYTQPMQQSFQRYAARFVMTNLESEILQTLPAQLLALIPAFALRENNAWVNAFRPQSNQQNNGVDMRDIGAIGIEANIEGNPSGYGSRIDTKSSTFKPENLNQMVSSIIKPGLIMSLDIPECAPQTWYNGVFAAAAAGDMNAKQAIVNAANYLTHGAFGRHFNVADPVVMDENNRIHLGHYHDRNGVKRDIRDFDYLAILNLIGEKDPAIAREWSDTFLQTQYPLPQRLAHRLRIIKGFVDDVVVTGFARRVSFTTHFIDALALGCKDAGLQLRTVQPYADMGSYERATGNYANGTLSGAGTTGLFNSGYGNTNPVPGGNRFGGRWF